MQIICPTCGAKAQIVSTVDGFSLRTDGSVLAQCHEIKERIKQYGGSTSDLSCQKLADEAARIRSKSPR